MMMFSAMILACGLNNAGEETCAVFIPPYVSLSMEQCVQDLNTDMKTIHESGWIVLKYECYDWDKSDLNS